jgi:hypothetical protein
MQAVLAGGEAPGALVELFEERWRRAGGRPLDLPSRAPATAGGAPALPEGTIELGPATVALSRTDPCLDGSIVREVECLMSDAIDRARRLIYMETQYFSSRAIRDALLARMRRRGERLEIVVVVNERAEALKEEIAVGLRQAQVLEDLRAAADRTGHALGAYFTLCDGPHDAFRATYIHSKLLIADDRFLTVGSANLTNRSMGLDSELHVSWEAGEDGTRGERRLRHAIRRLRVSVLAEHAGLRGVAAVRPLVPMEGLVSRLDAIAALPGARLQRHGPPTPAQAALIGIVDPQALPFDPETPGSPVGNDEPTEQHAHRRLPFGAAAARVGKLLHSFGPRRSQLR